jgi:hypothetical protein
LWLSSRSLKLDAGSSPREHGRLDLSFEDLILHPQWHELFSDEQAETTRRRLEDFGYVLTLS